MIPFAQIGVIRGEIIADQYAWLFGYLFCCLAGGDGGGAVDAGGVGAADAWVKSKAESRKSRLR